MCTQPSAPVQPPNARRDSPHLGIQFSVSHWYFQLFTLVRIARNARPSYVCTHFTQHQKAQCTQQIRNYQLYQNGALGCILLHSTAKRVTCTS